MAQQTINIGTNPNDGAGDPLRSAFNKANLNFTELYSTAANLTATLAALAAEVEGMDLSALISTAEAQSFSAAQRAQHGVNSGCLVTLPFRLLARAAQIVPATFVLPPLPFALWLTEGLLVVDEPGNMVRLTGDTDSGLAAFATQSWGEPSAAPHRQAIGITGQLQRGETLSLEVTDVIMDGTPYDAQPPTGLTLWLRGVWTA